MQNHTACQVRWHALGDKAGGGGGDGGQRKADSNASNLIFFTSF